MNVYGRVGLCAQTILMDNEFEKVQDCVPSIDMNTPAAAEHIAEIERSICVIKKHAHGIFCTLPYLALPHLMLIQLIYFVVMWLNNFPSATSIFMQFLPRELILHHRLDYNKHCWAPFGAYCKTHEENRPTNTMLTYSTSSICLGPTGNCQGSYFFAILVTGQITKCRGLTEIPVPQSVIDRVAHYAKKTKSSAGLN